QAINARTIAMSVFGSAGTTECRDPIKREGAHGVLDHRKPGYQESILHATGGRGLDIILEMLANVNLASDLKLLATRGRVIVIGNRGEITINPRDLMTRTASVRGFTLSGIAPPPEPPL